MMTRSMTRTGVGDALAAAIIIVCGTASRSQRSSWLTARWEATVYAVVFIVVRLNNEMNMYS